MKSGGHDSEDMSILLDVSVEGLRFDLVVPEKRLEKHPKNLVDVDLVLHLRSEDPQRMARDYVKCVLNRFQDGIRLHAKCFVCDFNSALVYVRDEAKMISCSENDNVGDAGFASLTLADWLECVREHTTGQRSTRSMHEVIFCAGGASTLFLG